MESKSNAYMETEPIGRLMRRYAVPCIISLLVAALYNIVDQIFIANASDLGSYGNAANTVVFPLTVVALAVAVLIGDGFHPEAAEKVAGELVEFVRRAPNTVVVSDFIYLIFMDPLLTMFGGRVNEETFRLSREYFFYIALGIPFYMFGQALNPIIRSDGSPKFAMAATVAGAVANTILDPLFIFGFRWGMMGAAVATVIGQVLTAALSIGYLCRMKSVRLRRESFSLRGELIAKFLPLGLCSLLSQISLVFAMAAINNMTREYGALDEIFSQPQYAQIPMAVVGIVMKFFQIVISIAIGLAAGCIPIVGYNVGAKRWDRARKLLWRLLAVEAAVGIVATLVAELLPRPLIVLFGAANESVYYTDFAIRAFRIYLCTAALACMNKGAFIFLQSLGKAFSSTMLSMVREIVFGVGFALLLPRFFGLDGVLYSMPASDVLAFVLSAFVLLGVDRALRENRAA